LKVDFTRQLGVIVQTIQLFTNDILCLFVGRQSEKDRLTKLVILRL